MNCESLKVAFAGTPEFAAVALQALLNSSHQVVGVLTQPDRPSGRGRKLTPSAVKQCAVEAGVPVLQPVSLKSEEAVDAVRQLNADVLVVAAYGLILPQSVLDIPPMGCLNIHASLLPRWRGAAPIHRAILEGDSQTGVCIMQMDAGLDTGDILLEIKCDIEPDQNSSQLHDVLAELGAQGLLEALPARCRGELHVRVQPEEGVSYAEKLSKSEARLDFSQPAEALHRRVRAFNPWPVAEGELNGQRVRLWRSQLPESPLSGNGGKNEPLPGTVVAVTADSIRVRAADQDIEFLVLQWPGKKAQSAREFAQGHDLIGSVFTPVGQ